MEMELPEGVQQDAETATIYVRPHLLDLEHRPSNHSHFRARVKHINAAGSQVKVELVADQGDLVHVEISQERYRALALERDVDVFVTPKEKKTIADSATAAH